MWHFINKFTMQTVDYDKKVTMIGLKVLAKKSITKTELKESSSFIGF